MPKTATIAEIEHRIQPADQLKLLEKMVRHLKRSFAGQTPAQRKKMAVSRDASAVRGALKQYANPALRERESEAFRIDGVHVETFDRKLKRYCSEKGL